VAFDYKPFTFVYSDLCQKRGNFERNLRQRGERGAKRRTKGQHVDEEGERKGEKEGNIDARGSRLHSGTSSTSSLVMFIRACAQRARTHMLVLETNHSLSRHVMLHADYVHKNSAIRFRLTI